jgi:hypothetical protein
MALVTGPLHSDDASGKFAGALVFAKWKGRNYTRQLVTPANPKSAAQTGIRSMMKWVAKSWADCSAGNKLTWDALAAAKNISAFNAMVSENLDRWQYNSSPTRAYPAAEILNTLDPDAIGDDGVILTTTGYAGYAAVGAKPDTTANADAIAAVLFRAAAAPTPISWATAVAILAVTPGTAWNYTDSPLDAATYHYKLAYFSVDGCISALSAADNTAVVT